MSNLSPRHHSRRTAAFKFIHSDAHTCLQLLIERLLRYIPRNCSKRQSFRYPVIHSTLYDAVQLHTQSRRNVKVSSASCHFLRSRSHSVCSKRRQHRHHTATHRRAPPAARNRPNRHLVASVHGNSPVVNVSHTSTQRHNANYRRRLRCSE